MDSRFGLSQLELRASCNDAAAMIEELGSMSRMPSSRGRPFMNREHDQPVALLQLGMLVELVEHDLGSASRLSSTTMRMPSRSDSSRKSLMPSMRLSFTSSAMRSI